MRRPQVGAERDPCRLELIAANGALQRGQMSKTPDVPGSYRAGSLSECQNI